VTKSGRETMEILEAFDLTKCPTSAAALVGCDPKTVSRYIAIRDAGGDPTAPTRRPRLIDDYLEKVEELVERSRGKVRADIVHDEHLVPMGFGGDERTTRRAVADAKERYRSGRRRSYRPWIPEPGMWLQFDWGEGPRIGGRRTNLFCAWAAWSRFRVVLPTWDRTFPTLICALDQTLRALGGCPTYLLTDNEKTVTTGHVAGVAIRHPLIVAAARHYGVVVETCVPYDPESKGGSEATVRVAKADLVPTEANLLEEYPDFASLQVACVAFSALVNARPHAETRRRPAEMLAEEQARFHRLVDVPFVAAHGETRVVRDDQTIRFGSVRYSTPPGHIGKEVRCSVHGDELVIVAEGAGGLFEIARHELSTPGRPRISDEHYPDHPGGNEPRVRPLRPRGADETAFLAIGPGAEQWLREAGATGVARVRSKMAGATELAALLGNEAVDRALSTAAIAGRFDDGDLATIAEHLERHGVIGDLVSGDESFSIQPGTAGWGGMGR
jgi:transposase